VIVLEGIILESRIIYSKICGEYNPENQLEIEDKIVIGSFIKRSSDSDKE
jgi:hypothetical protein